MYDDSPIGSSLVLSSLLLLASLNNHHLQFALRGNHKRPPNPQGPWHECLWMSGQQCSHFIESQVPSYIKIEFMHKDEVNSVKDFHPNRVVIWLDANEQVIEVPTRG